MNIKRYYYSCSVFGCLNTTINCAYTFFSLPNDIERCDDQETQKEPEKDQEAQQGKLKRSSSSFVKDYLVDYTANSNLHGLKYIGEKERTYFEKIFWLFSFICCVVLCAGLISKVYKKWDESPVIVSFAESSTPVWQIPYPAVTICFETKSMQSKFNFTHYFNLHKNSTAWDNVTEETKNLFEDISLVCDSHLSPTDGRKTSDPIETVNNIKAMAPNLTEVIFGCKWKEVPSQNCSELFSPVLTEEGQCYTFNTLGADDLLRTENLHDDYPYLELNETSMDWTLDGGYGGHTTLETYPHRGAGYGAKAGITFLLQANVLDLDYLCRGPVQGFKILLHNPAELPRLSQQFFRSPLSQEVIVAVKPKMMTTSEGLRPYPPERRQCFFPNERYLQYFKVYTQSNCEMECLSNFTYARCGCIQFGMPRGPNMEVCNAGSVECMKSAQMELVTVEVLRGLDKLDESQNETQNMRKAQKVAEMCKCLPSCTSIEYEAETSQADYNWRAIFRAHEEPITEEFENLLFGRVMIFFKEPQFITSRRSELYGQTDFLANCGGLLGLFMGFSILSFVEVLYFLTLRLYCMYWRRGQRAKSSIAPTNDEQKNDIPLKSYNE